MQGELSAPIQASASASPALSFLGQAPGVISVPLSLASSPASDPGRMPSLSPSESAWQRTPSGRFRPLCSEHQAAAVCHMAYSSRLLSNWSGPLLLAPGHRCSTQQAATPHKGSGESLAQSFGGFLSHF